MEMSDGEIFTRYRQAKKKGEQVKILAQLNGVSTERIIEILVSKGVDNRCFNNFRSRFNNQVSKKSAATEPTVNYMQKHVEESLKKAVTEQLEKAKNMTPIFTAPEDPKPEKIPPVVLRALKAGLEDLTSEIEARRDRIEELEAEIAEYEKDIAALKAWKEEHI